MSNGPSSYGKTLTNFTKAQRRELLAAVLKIDREKSLKPSPALRGRLSQGESEMIRGKRELPDGLMTRAANLKPDTINEKEHSVEAVITTEDPAAFWSFDEILILGGMNPEKQVPFITDHRQYDSTKVIGSVLNIRAVGDELLATLMVDVDLGEDALGIWKRISKGHLRRYSIGYRYGRGDYIDIAAGQSATIAGRLFTAGARTLRVVTKWYLDEVSSVVVPADRRAQSRQHPGTDAGNDSIDKNDSNQDLNPSRTSGTMPPIILLLRTFGLPEQVTEVKAALQWYADQREKLNAEQRTSLEALAQKHNETIPQPTKAAETGNQTTSATGTLLTGVLSSTDDSAVRNEAIAAERARVNSINQLNDLTGGVIPANVVRQAIDEGWTAERAQAHFAGLAAGQRSTHPNAGERGGQAPAGHVHQPPSVRSLQAALLEQCGIRPDSQILRASEMQPLLGRTNFNSQWLASGVRSTSGAAHDTMEQAFDQAGQQSIRGASFMRLCEELVYLETGIRFMDQNEIMERSQSSGNFTALFGLVTHVMMMQGYLNSPATYEQFCAVIDVPDLRKVDTGQLNGVGRLQKQGVNGGPAQLLNVDAPTIREIKADRYGGQLKVTEQVILGGSFGALDILPSKIGESARQVINDMGWAVLLANASLFTSDNKISDGVLSIDGLQAALTMLLTRKVGNQRITWTDILVACGVTLSAKADVVLTSANISNQKNPHANKYSGLVDNAIDLGVDDPRDQYASTYAGLPNSYYLFARPARSVVVAFREGTNRAPITRNAVLDKGEWGRVWDVYVDCGAAQGDPIAAVRVDEAAS